MNSLSGLVRLQTKVILRRGIQTSAFRLSDHSSLTREKVDEKFLRDFDPNNYDIPVRPVTMDDLMEPYGSYKVAYAAERKKGNRMIFQGVVSFMAACILFAYSGLIDGLTMPNLDNIMEETEPFNFDTEGRSGAGSE